MRGLIKKLLKENFEVISDISTLTTDVLKAAIRNFVNLAIKEKSSLNVFSSIFSIFDKIKRKYPSIETFLQEFNLTLKFSRNMDDGVVGKFKTFAEDEGLLILKLSPQEISASIQKHVLSRLSGPINEQVIEQMVDQIYKDVITDAAHDTVAHELQHGYDSWKSGGMYVRGKLGNQYRAKYPDENAPMTDKQYYDYLRLPYEINARFTEVLKRLKIIDRLPDGSFDMIDFDKVKSEFENLYPGFKLIQPKMAKRLIKRLFGYYTGAKEKFLKKGIDKLQQKTLKESDILNENATGKHLVVVDVQPEYAPYMNKMQYGLFEYINTHINELAGLTFLYNGEDTMGMVSENDYRMWLVENGLDEDIAYEATLYDKGYAFFRNCMDRGGDDEELVNLVRFMRSNDINDSREVDEEFWELFVEKYGSENVRELMEDSEDCISIPDLMDFLERYNNVVLVGGGINECLKEVELAMDALDKNYETWNKFTY
jgi:hypothetical protein